MSIELSETSEPDELVVELNGQLHADDLRRVIDQLDSTVEIRTFQIGIAADDPAAFSMFGVQANSETRVEENTDVTDESNPDKAEFTDADHDDTDSAEQSLESSPRLQADGDPFQLMQTIATLDSWVRTAELRDAIPEDTDVTDDSIGTNLWHLADRDLLEKRPYEEDKRQNEYRMTDVGEQALKQALEDLSDPQL